MPFKVPLGNILAFLCSFLVLANPLSLVKVNDGGFWSKVAEANASADQVQAAEAVRDFENFILLSFNGWDITYGLAIQTIATITGLIALGHTIYLNRNK